MISACDLRLSTVVALLLAVLVIEWHNQEALATHSWTSVYPSEGNHYRHCDEEYCESVVTKCTLNKRCTCNLKQPECAKDCLDCLEEKFGKCCGCVNLCPAHKRDIHSSHVGDLNETEYAELFDVLTETDDIYNRWSIMTLPAIKEIHHPDLGLLHMRLDKNKSLVASSPAATLSLDDEREEGEKGDGDSELDEGYKRENILQPAAGGDNDGDDGKRTKQEQGECVVAFINKQLSMSQCRKYCRSMGANAFRWFHDEGCCECVGKSCFHYGFSEPKCSIPWD